ncbi:MAG: hypothetical protein K0S53_1925 [Bacteroidetes bacterium]|jgi:hypothetical protein|nr:hypothetical protein [Bacteroidota bacterium]
MKPTKTNKRKALESEMKMIFKELCPTEEELEETVRDAMKAYSIVKHENQLNRTQI